MSIYESYDPVDIKSNSSNKVAVIANDYYNDDYITFTGKRYMNETLSDNL